MTHQLGVGPEVAGVRTAASREFSARSQVRLTAGPARPATLGATLREDFGAKANRRTGCHDVNVVSIHLPGLGGFESILEPVEMRTITISFDQPGTHTFICTLPGHAAAGMTGATYETP